jgi:hypothetical protein
MLTLLNGTNVSRPSASSHRVNGKRRVRSECRDAPADLLRMRQRFSGLAPQPVHDRYAAEAEYEQRVVRISHWAVNGGHCG